MQKSPHVLFAIDWPLRKLSARVGRSAIRRFGTVDGVTGMCVLTNRDAPQLNGRAATVRDSNCVARLQTRLKSVIRIRPGSRQLNARAVNLAHPSTGETRENRRKRLGRGPV